MDVGRRLGMSNPVILQRRSIIASSRSEVGGGGGGGGGGGTGPLPTVRLTTDVGGTDGPSGDNTYCYIYPTYDEPTMQHITNNPSVIGWDAGDLYALGGTVWVVKSLKIVQGRIPGRLFNFHNCPVRPNWLTSPHVSGGVSVMAIDWKGNTGSNDGVGGAYVGGMRLYLEGNGQYGPKAFMIMSDAEMDAARVAGTWIDVVMKIKIATDGTGSVKIWVQGENTARVDVTGCRTAWQLDHGIGPQTGWALWTGIYNSAGIDVKHIVDMIPPRVGHTLAEALKVGVDPDFPVTLADIQGSTYKVGGGQAWTYTSLTSRDASDVAIGASVS